MDSITQATLGAAVGEVVLGRKAGNKAILWGAVAGTLPDLDVLAYPLMDQITRLGWHRGPSHAFFFLTLAAPLLGWAISKIHRRGIATWREWTIVVYLAFVTHVLLDAFTVYGTQLFRPFSRLPVGFDTISIIDPLYTVPLLLAVIIVLFLRRHAALRKRIIMAGLVLSTFYLALTVLIKTHVNAIIRTNLEQQDIPARRFISTPTFLNSILWRVTADVDDGFYVGYYSLLDDDDSISFSYLPKNDSLLQPVWNTAAVAQLEWFSRGYYVVRRLDNEIQLADIRFGTIDAGRPESRRFIFEWQIQPTPAAPGRGKLTQLEFSEPDFGGLLDKLWQRLLGNHRLSETRLPHSSAVRE